MGIPGAPPPPLKYRNQEPEDIIEAKPWSRHQSEPPNLFGGKLIEKI